MSLEDGEDGGGPCSTMTRILTDGRRAKLYTGLLGDVGCSGGVGRLNIKGHNLTQNGRRPLELISQALVAEDYTQTASCNLKRAWIGSCRHLVELGIDLLGADVFVLPF